MSDEPREEQVDDAEVEGHKKTTRLNEDGTETEEPEVEGHRRHSALNEADDDEPDVEGHMRARH